jgi:hypothetical protein
MRWILSLILVPLMIVGAVVTTFFLMVMLNGYPSLPDAMVNLYLASACGLILGLSLLAGFLTGKLSEAGKFPGWVIEKKSLGNDLLSREVALQVPSALTALTTRFEM